MKSTIKEMPKPSKLLSLSLFRLLEVQRSKAYRNTMDNTIKRGKVK